MGQVYSILAGGHIQVPDRPAPKSQPTPEPSALQLLADLGTHFATLQERAGRAELAAQDVARLRQELEAARAAVPAVAPSAAPASPASETEMTLERDEVGRLRHINMPNHGATFTVLRDELGAPIRILARHTKGG